MKFILTYEGELPPTNKQGHMNEIKQAIRRQIHSQLSILWKQQNLKNIYDTFISRNLPDMGNHSLPVKKIGNYSLVPLVSDYLRTITNIEIIFLRKEEPGSLVLKGGDIDNRIKTLLAGLSIPNRDQILKDDNHHADEDPFFCLLEHYGLISGLSVTTDRLLRNNNGQEVMLFITVNVNITEKRAQNWGLDF